jgi:nucleotide-binding universal stress UspA family protein
MKPVWMVLRVRKHESTCTLARQRAEIIVDEIMKFAEAKNVKATAITQEDSFSVVETTVDHATKYNVDIIVIGTR